MRLVTRILAIRLAIFALPFAGWWIWRLFARRSGRDAGATPWAWLIGGGALLTALSLVVTAVFPAGPDTGTYVPGQVTAGGAVTEGHFVPRSTSSDSARP